MTRMLMVLIMGVIMFTSCDNERVFTPKPRMYPRIIYPERIYEDFTYDACKFTFQRPSYSTIKTGIKFFGEEASSPCWFDLEIKDLNASIHFSYNKIEGENTLQKLVTDAFKLAEKHNVKADYIDEIIIENKNGIKGLLFNMEGPVASPINFFMTDTTKHFVRASLYFNDAVNPDSIAPILKFVGKDIDKILETFEWRE